MSVQGVRSLLRRHGLLARRDLGQNCLVDEHMAVRLAELAGVARGDSVVEIGTGFGTLTLALAERARRVLTIEVDAGLVRALRAEQTLPAHVELIHADALRVDLARLVGDLEPPVRLVANLPYAISAPLLRRLLELREVLAEWSVMVQSEVAQRLLAQAGSRSYGSLSVLHRLSVQMRREAVLQPRCFFPVPRVRSAFLRMTPLAQPRLEAGELDWVERVVRAAFSQRRKTLVNALRAADLGLAAAGESARRALERLGADVRVRAEGLQPEQLLELARELARERVRSETRPA